MRFLGEHLEFDAVHLLKLLSALVGEVDPREVKILGEVLKWKELGTIAPRDPRLSVEFSAHLLLEARRF